MRSSLQTLFLAAALATSATTLAADSAMPAYERSVLANGTEVLLMEKHDVPLIAINARVRGGSLTDPVGQEGTASLLAGLMQRAPASRNRKLSPKPAMGPGGS